MELSSPKLKKSSKAHTCQKITKPYKTKGEEFHRVHTKTSLLEPIFKALFKKRLYERCFIMNFVKFS